MIIAQYQKLKKAPWSKNLEIWLYSWEKTYKDALNIDLSDMQGNRPVKDFVSCAVCHELGYRALNLKRLLC